MTAILKKCEWCGREFAARSSRDKYCYDNCRKAAARSKARDRRERRAHQQVDGSDTTDEQECDPPCFLRDRHEKVRTPRTVMFFVEHRPVPKGSISAIPGRRIFFNHSKIKDVSEMIRMAAIEAGVKLVEDSVIVRCDFFFARPKSHYKRDGTLKEGVPEAHTKRPDVDKLLRCVLDALTGIAYKDDSQVFEASGIKQFFHKNGIRIRVTFNEECEYQDLFRKI